jgi:hypothetical protein
MLQSAPPSSSNARHSSLPSSAAVCNGVTSNRSLAFTSAANLIGINNEKVTIKQEVCYVNEMFAKV